MQIYRNFTEAYYDLVDSVYNKFDFECAPRGQKIREIICASFVIQDPRNRLLYIPERKFSLQYVVAEILWYMLGDNTTEWIGNYSSMWNGISDDGVTANSAYGSRIFKAHDYHHFHAEGSYHSELPRDWTQWKFVKEELKRDPDSRRAVIHIRQPQDSYLATKDVPCTNTLQFFIRDKKLMLVVNMRSTDLIFGLGNDVPAFTFMQEMMAFELGIELGPYVHVSNSLHVYERHFAMCEQILKGVVNYAKEPLPMPAIKSAMPIQNMDSLQRHARKTEDSQLIMKFLGQIGPEVSEEMSDLLWRDWCRILLVHRLQKLKLEKEKAEVIQSIEFEGFKELL